MAEKIPGALEALKSEGHMWSVDLPRRKKVPMRVGRMATGMYYMGEISGQRANRLDNQKEISQEHALNARRVGDPVFAFRERLTEQVAGIMATTDLISLDAGGELSGFRSYDFEDNKYRHSLEYYLRITEDGEFYLLRDGDLTGELAADEGGKGIEHTYTYHVSGFQNKAARIIFPTSLEPKMRYRIQDDPYTDYFEHVTNNLQAFGMPEAMAA